MHKEVRDMILMVSDRAEELGDDETAWALRDLAEGRWCASREIDWKAQVYGDWRIRYAIPQFSMAEIERLSEDMRRRLGSRFLELLNGPDLGPQMRPNQPITDRE